ncbi:putative NADH dehydrogenase [Cavenderia fasciculata]|uniref:NADH dehydrogenase n=1 Tax=Cavenderia fasciculata TaxID=261658 RepID=F4PMT3_CACFS|nr:putative NADH dehydrogenase [Cavenderia fasciculata]EGG23677.1 putative NADH dehydrogenase [Cavenderia fasciculata]|eukprot:XP_004361528.1 putative NADH dehydrogenase [Cavenderia fasciculata]
MEPYSRAELIVSVDSIWSVCERTMYAFEKCKIDNGNDPQACLKYSVSVAGCTQKIMREITKTCKPELDKAVHCVEENNMRTLKCTKETEELFKCFKTNSFEKLVLLIIDLYKN